MSENEPFGSLRGGGRIMLSVLSALDVFEKTGRRDQFVAVLDQIKAFEEEFRVHPKISKPTNTYV